LDKSRPNLSVLTEYKQKHTQFTQRQQDLENHTAVRDQKKQEFDELRTKRLNQFMSGFTAISQKLKEMYQVSGVCAGFSFRPMFNNVFQMITLGGNAELELVDSLDPFSEGILFSVMPPKKSWKNIANLSGGEKVLWPTLPSPQTLLHNNHSRL
jgi:structural maintenance of chromosome 4